MKIKLSVIVPSYNRLERLQNCIEHLKPQTLSKTDFEVIVVNDGSADGTKAFLENLESDANYSFVRAYNLEQNGGAARARNHALHHARGELILFIGDDIYLTKTCLEDHVNFHDENKKINEICLGLVEWYGEVDDFMTWMTNGGPQFAYYRLKPGAIADFRFFYTCNISMKKALFAEDVFDESFKSYGWEDIELAYRLHKKYDIKIKYKPEILAYHDDPMNECDLEKRMRNIGKNALFFEEKHPDLKVTPRGLKRVILWLITRLPLFLFPKRIKWTLKMKKYWLESTHK